MRFGTIYKIKMIFDNIGFKLSEEFDFEKYENLVFEKMPKCLSVMDFHDLVEDYNYISKKQKKIAKFTSSKHKYKYDLIETDIVPKIEFCKDDQYVWDDIFTTALSKNKKIINHISYGDPEFYVVKRRFNKFTVFKDNKFTLVHKLGKIIIEDETRKILVLLLRTDFKIKTKLNKSNYEIFEKEGVYYVHHRYFKGDESITAEIEVDLLNEKSNLTSSMVNICEYRDEEGIELFLIIAIGILLLVSDYDKLMKRKLISAYTLSLMANRR